MASDFPYLCFLKIFQQCREQVIKDVLEGNPDLYEALYSDINSEIYQVKMEIYELKWIESHWKEIIKILEKKDTSNSEKQELIILFAKWYKKFISQWSYSEYDIRLLEEKIYILKNLVLQNSAWEQNVKKMKVSFEKSNKILSDKIKELEKEI